MRAAVATAMCVGSTSGNGPTAEGATAHLAVGGTTLVSNGCDSASSFHDVRAFCVVCVEFALTS